MKRQMSFSGNDSYHQQALMNAQQQSGMQGQMPPPGGQYGQQQPSHQQQQQIPQHSMQHPQMHHHQQQQQAQQQLQHQQQHQQQMSQQQQQQQQQATPQAAVQQGWNGGFNPGGMNPAAFQLNNQNSAPLPQYVNPSMLAGGQNMGAANHAGQQWTNNVPQYVNHAGSPTSSMHNDPATLSRHTSATPAPQMMPEAAGAHGQFDGSAMYTGGWN
jgi:hypothetical protein